MMGEYFKGWRQVRWFALVVAMVAMTIAAYLLVVRIRAAFQFSDHGVIGPIFAVAHFGTFVSPIIGGVIAAFIGRRFQRDEYRWIVAAGVILGFGISAICSKVATHLAFEYLA